MDEEEHEVYGGDIPDLEVDMTDADRIDEDALKNQELDDMKKRLKQMEEDATALREMQAKVEKEMGVTQDPANAASTQDNKEEIDSRSVFVGNIVMKLCDDIRLETQITVQNAIRDVFQEERGRRTNLGKDIATSSDEGLRLLHTNHSATDFDLQSHLPQAITALHTNYPLQPHTTNLNRPPALTTNRLRNTNQRQYPTTLLTDPIPVIIITSMKKMSKQIFLHKTLPLRPSQH
ncbi:hypothetical protein GIB67_037679 [Kingdonia uniflora]|uniref:Uncharacterized protein n=1 Tax=Kingdonia uniflora TaxID=39325 RepID=A0A7J7MKY3_9MAGN|nr:hypothetical protein GIB67_037679 [Kingdonia uniflora]